MKAFVFDLGDTLIEYEGLPLSWEAHYPEALRRLADSLSRSLNADDLEAGCSVLRSYNTRLNPRDREVTFTAIADEIFRAWNFTPPLSNEVGIARNFFQVFRQRLRCFSETKTVLQTLRQQGFAIGIFTDVPYGMPRELVLADIRETALDGLFDVLLTSRESGYRKPRVETITAVATSLGCTARDVIHVGNEKKDIDVARAFGCRAVLVNRGTKQIDWGQDRTIAALSELLTER